MNSWSERMDSFLSDMHTMSDTLGTKFESLDHVIGWDFDGLARNLVPENTLPKTTDSIALHSSGAVLFIEFKPTKKKFDGEDSETVRETKDSVKLKASDSVGLFRRFLQDREVFQDRPLWFILVTDNPRIASTYSTVPHMYISGDGFLRRYAVKDADGATVFYDRVEIMSCMQFIRFSQDIIDPSQSDVCPALESTDQS